MLLFAGRELRRGMRGHKSGRGYYWLKGCLRVGAGKLRVGVFDELVRLASWRGVVQLSRIHEISQGWSCAGQDAENQKNSV